MERYYLWSLFIQLAYFLFPVDFRVDFIEEILQDAAEDPELELEYYAMLLMSTDRLLKR